jgi:hypothetical protein
MEIVNKFLIPDGENHVFLASKWGMSAKKFGAR